MYSVCSLWLKMFLYRNHVPVTSISWVSQYSFIRQKIKRRILSPSPPYNCDKFGKKAHFAVLMRPPCREFELVPD